MSKCVSGCGTGLLATIAAVTMLGSGQTARAGEDCLSAPNREPGAGGHWYYHLDRAHDRKCWYLVEPEARVPVAEPVQPPTQQPPQQSPLTPPAGSAPTTAQPSSIETFFSSLSSPFNGQQSAPPAPSQLPPAGTYTTQSLHLDEPAASTATPRPVRTAHHTDDAQASAKRPPRAHPSPAPGDDGASGPKNQTERDALFQEFLRWRESR